MLQQLQLLLLQLLLQQAAGSCCVQWSWRVSAAAAEGTRKERERIQSVLAELYSLGSISQHPQRCAAAESRG